MSPSKVYTSLLDTLFDMRDKVTVLISGVNSGSMPFGLINALKECKAKELTLVYSVDAGGQGEAYTAIDSLVDLGMVSRVISPMPFIVGEDSVVRKAWESGDIEIDIQPMGILSERLRSGGAGLGGVFLPTSLGTRFEESKEKRVIEGQEYVLEHPLKADFALIKAQKSDTLGNLTYRGFGRNWGPVMAMASSVCIAEVDEICELGALDPEKVITQGIFVNRIVQAES